MSKKREEMSEDTQKLTTGSVIKQPVENPKEVLLPDPIPVPVPRTSSNESNQEVRCDSLSLPTHPTRGELTGQHSIGSVPEGALGSKCDHCRSVTGSSNHHYYSIVIQGSATSTQIGGNNIQHIQENPCTATGPCRSPTPEQESDIGAESDIVTRPHATHPKLGKCSSCSALIKLDSPLKVGVPESQLPSISKGETQSNARPSIEEISKTHDHFSEEKPDFPPSVKKCWQHLKDVYRIRFEKYTAVTLYQKHELGINVYVPLRFREVNEIPSKQREIAQDDLHLSANQRIVFYGGSGQGKTTFCQKLVYRWSQQKRAPCGIIDPRVYCGMDKLSEFDLVFYLEGKRIGSKMTVMDAVYDQLLSMAGSIGIEKGELEQWVHENQEKVCFIVDGLDEIPDTNDDLDKFIKLEHLVKTHAIFTAQSLPVVRCQKYYGVCDFSPEDVSHYIQLYFQGDLDKAKRLENKLKTNCNLRCLMSIPLFCLLMCFLWKYREETSQPATETNIFKEIFDLSMENYCKTHSMSISDPILRHRCLVNYSLAWKGIKVGKLTFSEKEISEAIKEEGEGCEEIVGVKDVIGLGFLVKVSGHSNEGLDYSFSHAMFQQLLAAMYVKEVNKSKLYEDCWSYGKTRAWRQSYENVGVFLAGLLDDNAGPLFDAFGRKYNALQTNEKAPRECLYKCVLLVCRCLTQTKNPNNYTHSIVSCLSQHRRVFLNVFQQDLDDHTLKALSYMLKSDQCAKNECHGVIQSLLLANLTGVGEHTLSSFCEALQNCKWLQELGLCVTTLSSKSCHLLHDAVAHNRSLKKLNVEAYLDSMLEDAILTIPIVLKNKELKVLRLFTMFVKQCPPSCKTTKSLEHCSCPKRQAVGRFVEAFADALSANESLESLILTDCFFNGCPNSDKLKLAILNHPTLSCLSVSGQFNGSGQISASGMKTLTDILRLRTLKKFSLSLTTLSSVHQEETNDQVQMLVEALLEAYSLEKIKFTFTCLSVAHQVQIANFIQHTKLRSVKLSWKAFSPMFLQALGDVLAGHPAPNLNKLFLKGGFRPGETKALLRGIKDNTQIESVVLDGNPFQAEFISEFIDEISEWKDRKGELCVQLEGEILQSPLHGRPCKKSEVIENHEKAKEVCERVQSLKVSCRNVTLKSNCTPVWPNSLLMDDDW